MTEFISPDQALRLEDAENGVAIFGSIGSGKTSGLSKHIASAYLAHDFGGVMLCIKPEEVSLWRRWTEEQERSDAVKETEAAHD